MLRGSAGGGEAAVPGRRVSWGRILRASAAYALAMTKGMNDDDMMSWFLEQAKPYGIWDFKRCIDTRPNGELTEFKGFDGAPMTMEDFGNRIFGCVGCALNTQKGDLLAISLGANNFRWNSNEASRDQR